MRLEVGTAGPIYQLGREEDLQCQAVVLCMEFWARGIRQTFVSDAMNVDHSHRCIFNTVDTISVSLMMSDPSIIPAQHVNHEVPYPIWVNRQEMTGSRQSILKTPFIRTALSCDSTSRCMYPPDLCPFISNYPTLPFLLQHLIKLPLFLTPRIFPSPYRRCSCSPTT
jgi:hypothetical protein